MYDLSEHPLQCPYCGETITLLIDSSLPHQRYVEDCSVCCSPIVVDVRMDEEGIIQVQGWQENG